VHASDLALVLALARVRVLEVAGQRVGVPVQNNANESVASDAAAMIADNVGVCMLRKQLHDLGLLDEILGNDMEHVVFLEKS